MWGFTLRGSWRPNITEIFNPKVMAVSVVSFSFFRAAQPEPWSPVPKLHRGSQGPTRPGLAFPTTSLLLRLQLYCLTSVLTELYNSSTPTRSLKSHVGSSSSGNNCHAVHRSLSSGASVYECPMGIFYLVPFHQPISAHAISSHNGH